MKQSYEKIIFKNKLKKQILFEKTFWYFFVELKSKIYWALKYIGQKNEVNLISMIQ